MDDTCDLEILLEVGRVGTVHLQEDHRGAHRDAGVATLLSGLESILLLRAVVRLVGDDADRARPLGFGVDEIEGRGIHRDGHGAQLEGSLHPRNDRHHQDPEDEKPGDSDTLWSFDHVDDRRIGEDRGHHGEADRRQALLLVQGGQEHRN